MYVTVRRDEAVVGASAIPSVGSSRRVIMAQGLDAASPNIFGSTATTAHQTLDERFRAISAQRAQVAQVRRNEAKTRQSDARQDKLAAVRNSTISTSPPVKASRPSQQQKPIQQKPRANALSRLGRTSTGNSNLTQSGSHRHVDEGGSSQSAKRKNAVPVKSRLTFPNQGRKAGSSVSAIPQPSFSPQVAALELPPGTPTMFTIGQTTYVASSGINLPFSAMYAPAGSGTTVSAVQRRQISRAGKSAVGANVFSLGTRGTGRPTGKGKVGLRQGVDRSGRNQKVSQEQLDNDLESYKQQGYDPQS